MGRNHGDIYPFFEKEFWQWKPTLMLNFLHLLFVILIIDDWLTCISPSDYPHPSQADIWGNKVQKFRCSEGLERVLGFFFPLQIHSMEHKINPNNPIWLHLYFDRLMALHRQLPSTCRLMKGALFLSEKVEEVVAKIPAAKGLVNQL